MATEKICNTCKGAGYYQGLISQHGDETQTVKCTNCNGKGVIHQMTEQEERDYWEDYW